MNKIQTGKISLTGKQIRWVIIRLCRYYDVESESALANCLELKSNAVNKWRHHGYIDLERIMECIPDISLDWLIYGNGYPRLNQEAPTVKHNDDKTQIEITIKRK